MARVLVVDDYDGFREAMAFCLTSFGHHATACTSAEVTSTLLAVNRPQVALVGVSPMALAGFTLCERLRLDSRWSGLPVVVLANPLTPGMEQRAKAVGAVAILPKPFEWSELLRVVERESPPGG